MNLISWNIQWCRGLDGRVDPARIGRTVRSLCEPDILCFQEVAAGFAALPGSAGEDQSALLAREFPGYTAHFAWGVDVPGEGCARGRFGNLILTRLPVQRVLRHSLPWPADAGVPSMPRVAIEAVVRAPWGWVSVTTTHLEYYSAKQRAAQLGRLCELHAERLAYAGSTAAQAYKSGPFEPFPQPAASILTGDFNMRPEDPILADLQECYVDAWRAAHPDEPHPPSFGLFDPQFSSAPYCCDFVFVSKELESRIVSVRIDAQTQASDHQPVIVELV